MASHNYTGRAHEPCRCVRRARRCVLDTLHHITNQLLATLIEDVDTWIKEKYWWRSHLYHKIYRC